MTGTTNKLQESDLDQFTGTDQWYRHGLMRHISFTDGVKYVADRAGAYWLIDEIATSQMIRKIAKEPLQVWKLQEGTRGATLSCEDGNHHEVFRKSIEFTDFPLPSITIWFTDNVILLPSEY